MKHSEQDNWDKNVRAEGEVFLQTEPPYDPTDQRPSNSTLSGHPRLMPDETLDREVAWAELGWATTEECKRRIRKQNREAFFKWVMLVIAVWIVIVLALVASGRASEFPEAPSQRIVDKTFVLGHVVYGAATAFDGYMTARNVGTCALERNIGGYGSNPSSRHVATYMAIEFAAVTAGDAAFKAIGRHNQFPTWLNKLGGNIGAIVGTTKHVHGGSQWVNLCY